jgi:hypothetical protein
MFISRRLLDQKNNINEQIPPEERNQVPCQVLIVFLEVATLLVRRTTTVNISPHRLSVRILVLVRNDTNNELRSSQGRIFEYILYS